MDLRPVRNTSLIEIRVLSEKAEDAAKYANAIARVYKEHRLQQWRERTQKGVAVLEERFNEQEAKVREAQSNVMYLQKALEIPDSMASEAGPSLLLSGETLRHIEGTRIESQFEHSRQDTMLNLCETCRKPTAMKSSPR